MTAQIPKCEKGRSFNSALKMTIGPAVDKVKTIWAETKYDGIRYVLDRFSKDLTICEDLHVGLS